MKARNHKALKVKIEMPIKHGDVSIKGNLYAIQFANGLVKFGHGIIPQRIYELCYRRNSTRDLFSYLKDDGLILY